MRINKNFSKVILIIFWLSDNLRLYYDKIV